MACPPLPVVGLCSFPPLVGEVGVVVVASPLLVEVVVVPPSTAHPMWAPPWESGGMYPPVAVLTLQHLLEVEADSQNPPLHPQH
jgi:hypothetical protein